MKFVVLLALVGLASCRTALVGGDRARDVTIEYSYWDDQGKEVKVEVKADKLGLDLSKDDSSVSLRKSPSESPVSPAQRVKVEDFRRPQTRTHFVQVEPQSAPRPQVETRFIQVPAPAVPRPTAANQFVQVQPVAHKQKPSVRFIEVEDFEAPEPKTEVRFIQVKRESRPEVETRFIQVKAPRPEFETKFVKVEASRPEFENKFVKFEAPRPEFETRFVQVQAKSAPAHRPAPRSQFVEVQHPAFQTLSHSSFQAARPVAPRHFNVPQAVSSFQPSVLSAGHQRSRSSSSSSSDDNSAEK